MADPEVWTWWLTTAEIDELLGATERFASVPETQLATLTPNDVVLPTLANRLRALRHELIAGRGFQLIRGLPAADIGAGHAAAAFVGLGTHLGSLRSQNANRDLLGHVRNVGLDAADPTVRIYQTDQRQTFHTDSTDAVGLCCLEVAESGGDSMLVSAAAIYNEMLDRRPDLARRLFDEVATDRRGEVPAGAEPFFRIPVLSWFDDRLTVIYQRQYINSAARFDDAPPLSPDMVAALDLFDEIANEPAMHLSMTLEVGDMQFVHNHSLLHDRTGFVDKPDAPRHLLRLWLSLPGDRELPDIFASRYGTTTVGNRGGLITSPR